MSKRVKAIIAFLLVLGLIISTPNFYAAAASPKLNKKAVTITIGNTAELFVKNTTKTVKWSSSNKAVAKVDADGEVTAKKAGKAKITAKVGKKKYQCNVTVPKQYISSKSVFIQKGSKQKLNVYGVSKDDSLFWGSDYESIATVSQSGEITANSLGETTVYAVLNNGYGKMYECQVVVYDRTNSGEIVTASPRPVWTPEPTKAPGATSTPGGTAVTNVKLSDKTVQVSVSQQKTLKATVVPDSAVNKRVTWNSANTAVARVGSDGTVTGMSAGTTIVYATTADGGFVAVCTVIVSGSQATPTPRPSATPVPSPTAVPTPRPSIVPVSKVTLSSSRLDLKAGDTRTLTAAIQPADATTKDVMWRSGNDSVARVDSSGKVTAVVAGATVILVTTMDGEFSAVCTVTVTGSSSVAPTQSPDNSPTSEPTQPPSSEATPTPSPMRFAEKEIPESGNGSFADLAQKFKDVFVKPNGDTYTSAFPYGETSPWWVPLPFAADNSRKAGDVTSVKLGDEILKSGNIRVSVGNNNHAEAPEYMITDNGLYVSLVFIALHNTDDGGTMKFTITESSGVQSTAVLKIDKLDNDMKCTEISRQYPAGTASVEVVSGTSASNSPLTATGGDSVTDSTGIASCTLQLSANYKQDEWKHMVYLTLDPSAEYYFVKKVMGDNVTYGFSPQDDNQGRLGLYPTAGTMDFTVASVTRHASATISITTNAPVSAASILRNVGNRSFGSGIIK